MGGPKQPADVAKQMGWDGEQSFICNTFGFFDYIFVLEAVFPSAKRSQNVLWATICGLDAKV